MNVKCDAEIIFRVERAHSLSLSLSASLFGHFPTLERPTCVDASGRRDVRERLSILKSHVRTKSLSEMFDTSVRDELFPLRSVASDFDHSLLGEV